ncbi:unnamed protein product [Periconia digitata]|uniref:Uncharacterized protein n=1 Tax=Periconia digitata TaxID=1303443 RepID=A0A9W4URZ3_9PLEO|nr:unnamed protein product [Periconia digitata]
MLGYNDLSVATVAGVIAAGVFAAQFLAPSLLTLILVGFLKQEDTAATWSVIGRNLHASHWPVLLRTDTAGVDGVRRSVNVITAFQLFVFLLISVSSIVTPLGLYETVAPQKDLKEQPFHYAKDSTSLGIGTMARRNDFGLSRYCGDVQPFVCPWSNTTIIRATNSTNPTNVTFPGGYDRRLPINITEVYTAGFNTLDKTVSSALDIQWRTYQQMQTEPGGQKGQPYIGGNYRHLQQVLLNNNWEIYEGLIVDTKDGGIGFRNHTIPATQLLYGAVWSEDILFIEPETECVDRNITVNFRNLTQRSYTGDFVNISVVDRGGFVNLSRDAPWFDKNKTWENANLRDRAYYSAWWSNVYTMYFLNVTNPKELGYPNRFHYLNSSLGARFPVDNGAVGEDFSLRYDQLRLGDQFGLFLKMNTDYNGTARNGSSYANPYHISTANFTNIEDACKGQWYSDHANISSVAITCGFVYGTPRRIDGGNPMENVPDAEWSSPLYSCASAARASIKTVSFGFNGTNDLKSLRILDIQPKRYNSVSEMPLWAVENTALRVNYAPPIWGITVPEFENHTNISTSRQDHLYLPGYSDRFGLKPFQEKQNLAGVDFYHNIMALVYGLEYPQDTTDFPMPDYSGQTNFGLFTRWQELSANSTSARQIVNLLWTEISANAVVGTRGQLSKDRLQEAESPAGGDVPSTVMVPVRTNARTIRFKVLYGVPAFIVLALLVAIALLALVFVLIGRTRLSKLQRFLDETSAGRIYTKFLYMDDYPPNSRHTVWLHAVGKKRVDISGSYPHAAEATASLMEDHSASDRK